MEPLPFSPYNQPAPALGNTFEADRTLRAYLTRVLPPEVHEDILGELEEMGKLAGGELYQLQLADRLNEPVLTQWDAWGNRIDHIELTALWKRAREVATNLGVVATGYEKKHGKYARIHQFALAYLFLPSTHIYGCPLSMTDGAARALLDSGNQALIDHAVPKLTSRDSDAAWTSGQWMTESTGGSDVGLSQTVAKQEDGQWRLYGRKWFTSAATSQMALTLGRPEGNGPGGRGLALFFVETRDENGRPQNIETLRLKDKLGTRKVPTAELILRGTPATLVSATENGVRNIAPMLNITRTWNAISSAALMARGLMLASDYAKKRTAFKGTLSKKPLHLDTLAEISAETAGAMHFAFLLTELLGALENESGSAESDGAESSLLLRLLTPVAKLLTAKQAVSCISEVLESFGGAGYVEDTGLPVLLRDAQVLTIWEGTTNVLALDFLKTLGREPTGLEAISLELEKRTKGTTDPGLQKLATQSLETLKEVGSWLSESFASSPQELEAGGRRAAISVGRAIELALLVEQASWSLEQNDPRAAALARQFARNGISRLHPTDPRASLQDAQMIFGSD